mmetsp:Transcript_1271/g.1953  ORF Transcript_1271/g.1953 Transcript_1271/m.1953 type:complete len:482 (-) Transcript_1271:36-1481(-)
MMMNDEADFSDGFGSCNSYFDCPARHKCYNEKCICNHPLLFAGDACEKTQILSYLVIGLATFVLTTSAFKTYRDWKRQRLKSVLSVPGSNHALVPCSWLLLSVVIEQIRMAANFIRLFHLPSFLEKAWADHFSYRMFVFGLGFIILAIFHAGVFFDADSTNNMPNIMPRWLGRRKGLFSTFVVLGTFGTMPLSVRGIDVSSYSVVAFYILYVLTIHRFLAAGFRLKRQLKVLVDARSMHFRRKTRILSKFAHRAALWTSIHLLACVFYSASEGFTLARPFSNLLLLLESLAFSSLAEILGCVLCSPHKVKHLPSSFQIILRLCSKVCCLIWRCTSSFLFGSVYKKHDLVVAEEREEKRISEILKEDQRAAASKGIHPANECRGYLGPYGEFMLLKSSVLSSNNNSQGQPSAVFFKPPRSKRSKKTLVYASNYAEGSPPITTEILGRHEGPHDDNNKNHQHGHKNYLPRRARWVAVIEEYYY